MTTPGGEPPFDPVPQAPAQPEPALVIPTPPKSSKAPLIIGIALGLVALVAIAAVGGYYLLVGRTTTVTATFTLINSEAASNGCQGTGGYSDIGSGAQAVLRDGSGQILGTASLGAPSDTESIGCEWTIVFNDVPKDRDFYAFEVSRRGEVRASRAELEAEGWKFSAGLGN